MAVVNQNETRAALGEVAKTGIHLPEPTTAHSEDHHEGHKHDDDHEHNFELVEVLRVVFVALAAVAVWFHLWEPFHKVSVISMRTFFRNRRRLRSRHTQRKAEWGHAGRRHQ